MRAVAEHRTPINLNSGWTLSDAAETNSMDIDVPFDVHTSLHAKGLIDDPYWRDNELSLDWIHEGEWIATRRFDLASEDLGGHWDLKFAKVDCFATIEVNGVVVGQTESAFLPYKFDISSVIHVGKNELRVTFHSNSAEATRAAKAFPFKLPYIDWNSRIPDVNLIRKPACHAGWDWNIALMPLGLYGDIALERNDLASIDDVKVVQRHEDGLVRLEVHLYGSCISDAISTLGVTFDGDVVAPDVLVRPDGQGVVASFDVKDPALWWPSGHGEQVLHDLVVELAGKRIEKRIGLRRVDLLTTPDEIGARFAFSINGREIFMKGANWIPADALPERATPEVVRGLLQSAKAAHMNMIRVWGGGQYEADWFYDICDEMGILVWQDFMFACNHYPGADGRWLDLVRQEARTQVRRLSSHPSVVLWCGDNELVGALNWWAETRENRDRYLANYVILNHALEEIVDKEDIDIPFWPSSPSSGRLNFGDAWHDDRSGDMHFWDVWHSAKDFEHYRTVKPRFCSEFGFQSLPSMPTVERFSLPEDRNISSPVMETHQRNVGGNSRIVESLARNFRFPERFEDMVYLSQVNQALAFKTAIEFWRANTPRCMGTLYWQLNDTWPVASWSSIEHGGAWKISHYMARRFFAPVLVTAQPDEQTGETVIYAVSDVPGSPVSLTISLALRGIRDGVRPLETIDVQLPYNQAVEIARLNSSVISGNEFLHLEWADPSGEHVGEDAYFPKRYKNYDLPNATVNQKWVTVDGCPALELRTDFPAYFVVADLGGETVFGDGGFLLLPDRPKTIKAGKNADQSTEAPLRYLNADRS